MSTKKETVETTITFDRGSRDYALTSYLPYEAIRDFVCQDFIAHYAYILHDRDIDSDGNPKTPHYHILLRLTNLTTFSALKRKIERFTHLFYLGSEETPQNTLLEAMKDSEEMFLYLTHRTKQAIADKKYMYDEGDIYSDQIGYWRGDYTTNRQSKNNVALDIIYDIEAGLTERQLLVRYGREYLINREKYRSFYEQMCYEENYEKNRYNRSIKEKKGVHLADEWGEVVKEI